MFSGALVMVGALLVYGTYASASPVSSSMTGPGPSDYNMRNVWQVLAHHDALEPDHQLARKSVRSPSRRLRFGRRSDPMMPPQPETRDLEELQEELMPEREVRAPVRLRFGRRSLEQAVPHVFPLPDSDDSLLRKEIRAPSMRLRFGRRADMFMLPYEQAEREFRTLQETEENAED